MISDGRRVCNCSIDGKQFDEKDETCIKCQNSTRVLEMLFDVAIKRAVETGDTTLIEEMLKKH